jgi:cell division septation protein DedD
MKHFVLCSVLLLCVINAQELKLDPYLSDLKHKEFSYDYEKSLLEKKKLRDSWIQPLQLRYTISKSNPYNEQGASTQKTQNAAIVMDQPIFQSGGIYYGIKFAQASYEYNKYSIDVAKRKLIKEAVQLLMQIKQNELSLQRQKLQIDNSRISLEQKQEQYLNGQLDSGFLNNAVIEKNVVTQKLFDLQTNHERLISKFEAISDLNYKEATVPHLKLVSSEDFLEHNIDVKQLKSETERNRFNKNVTIAKYLPKLSLTAGYNWDKLENPSFAGQAVQDPPETQYYNYGLKATIPIDINTFRDVESSRVEYLKSLVVIDDKKRELAALYEQVTQNLINFDKKIKLSIENKALYSKLLDETTQLYTAGYKTEYDVRNLANSVEIEKVDQRIFELDKQLELLNLYEKLVNVTPLREEHIESAPIQFTQEIEVSQAAEGTTVSMESDLVAKEKTELFPVPSLDKETNMIDAENVEQVVDEPVSAYYVQVASFASTAPDEALLKKINENNYSYVLYKVEVNDKLVTKVLIGPIENNIDDKLNEVRKKIESDAYLLKI